MKLPWGSPGSTLKTLSLLARHHLFDLPQGLLASPHVPEIRTYFFFMAKVKKGSPWGRVSNQCLERFTSFLIGLSVLILWRDLLAKKPFYRPQTQWYEKKCDQKHVPQFDGVPISWHLTFSGQTGPNQYKTWSEKSLNHKELEPTKVKMKKYILFELCHPNQSVFNISITWTLSWLLVCKKGSTLKELDKAT